MSKGARAALLALTPALAMAAGDPRGEPSIIRGIFGILLMVLGPILCAITLGLLQLGVYRLLVAAGAMKDESVPMFPVLIMRGLMLMLALIAVGVFYFKFGQTPPSAG